MPTPPFAQRHNFYGVLLIFSEDFLYLLSIFFPNDFLIFLVDSQKSFEHPSYQLLTILCITPPFTLCLLFVWSPNEMGAGLLGSYLLSFISQFPSLYLFKVHVRITAGLHIPNHCSEPFDSEMRVYVLPALVCKEGPFIW